MTSKYSFREFRENQRQTMEQTVQTYRAYLDTLEASRLLAGSMHWKKIKGREYLYRYRDRYGHGHSLGPRSPDTERRLAEFQDRRRELASRRQGHRQQLLEQARLCRAARLHRLPELVGRILRRLEQDAPPRLAGVVLGTPALHAYEFAAGAFIEAPRNAPFWAGAGGRLTLAAADLNPGEGLALLRRVDRSFQAVPGRDGEAANQAGFLIRWLTSAALQSRSRGSAKITPGTAVPAESGDLAFLLHSPKFSQVVIDRRGLPATMVVPDPRALALHKLWLSQQEDREPARRRRDWDQALALAELVLRYLPQYDFFSAQLHLFPPELVRRAGDLVEGYELPPELGSD